MQSPRVAEEGTADLAARLSAVATHLRVGETLSLEAVSNMLRQTEDLSSFYGAALRTGKCRNAMNLSTHLWISLRGILLAAEGFKESGSKASQAKSTAAAAVFSKLFYEGDVALAASGEKTLKPFSAPLASVGLQVGKGRRHFFDCLLFFHRLVASSVREECLWRVVCLSIFSAYFGWRV